MMRRCKSLLAAAVASALLCALAPVAPRAQNPPSERELQIYAGLHAAAANGEVAEIEKLIGEGENPNLQDARSRTPLRLTAIAVSSGAAPLPSAVTRITWFGAAQIKSVDAMAQPTEKPRSWVSAPMPM